MQKVGTPQNFFLAFTIAFFQKNKEKHGNILHLSTKNLNDMIYSSWDIECDGLKLIILGQFLPFYLPPPLPKNAEKTELWKNEKKNAWNIIILNMCTKNPNDMMCGSFHAEWDGQIVLSFWPIFCPFTRLATQKIKILKWKNHLEMSSFYSCVSKITIMMYGFSGMECDRHNFLSSKAISCPFTQLNTCTNNLEN